MVPLANKHFWGNCQPAVGVIIILVIQYVFVTHWLSLNELVHRSRTACLSTFANTSHFPLLNAVWRLTFPVSLSHPLAT